MRKKDLLEQNVSFFDKIQKISLENEKLKKNNEKQNIEINCLKSHISILEAELESWKNREDEESVPDIELIEKSNYTEKPDESVIKTLVNSDLEYGVQVIGKVIVESVRAVRMVSDNYELKNLIMYKTECVKSEIMNICDSAVTHDDKCRLMDTQFNEAVDYFKSVMGNK